MKVKFRRSCQDDLDQVYELHTRCFSNPDQWYKSAIKHHLNKGIVVEVVKTNLTKIIGVLLQGTITPCNRAIVDDCDSYDTSNDNLFGLETKTETIGKTEGYKEDVFEPVSENGKLFLENNVHFKDLYGIVMICVDPEYRGKGLAKKLIEKHWKNSSDKIVCLNTRRSNIGAFMLYKSIGYEHVANIKNKYFLPTEDSIFMIKELV